MPFAVNSKGKNLLKLAIGFAKPYWGKGIASEALAEFSKALFLNTDLVRLYASVFEGNTASAKVLEKCGFKLEAIFEKAIYKDGLFFNEYHYANVRTTN